jgi:hypothetical protein
MTLPAPDVWQQWPVAPLMLNAGLRGDLDVLQLGQQIVDALRGTTWPMAARAVWIDPLPDEKRAGSAYAERTGQTADDDVALYLLRLHVAPFAPSDKDVTADDVQIEAYQAICAQVAGLHGEQVNLSALPIPAGETFERMWLAGEHEFTTNPEPVRQPDGQSQV